MAKADIEIHGRVYSVACAPGQEERLLTLARELDDLVGKIAQAVGEVGPDRLLLVAALSLLDDLHVSRQQAGSSAESDLEEKAAAILLDAAERIDAIADRAEHRR